MNFLAKQIKHRTQSSRWPYVGAIAVLTLAIWPARIAQAKNFVFYFPKTHSILTTRSYQDVQYLPVLKVLNLLGQVTGMQAKRKSLKVWFNGTEVRLRENNRTVRLNNAKLRLSEPARTMEGQWMVPVGFLTQILPTLINQTVQYQKGQDRVFIGNIKPNSFTLHAESLQQGTRLTFQFAEPVQVRTAARNGRWVIYLGNRPFEPIHSDFQFRTPYVSRVQFQDQDGHPKLVVTPAKTGLDFFPTLGNGKKILTADIVEPKAAAAAPAPVQPKPQRPHPVPQQVPAHAAPKPLAAPQLPKLTLPAVVLDAAHGGSDPGAQGKGGLLEKNLTAQMVSNVSKALQATGRYQVILTRPDDQTVDFAQRTTVANTAHPIAFISFHAGNFGASAPKVMVYTYRPSSPVALAAGANPAPLFTAWEKVQLKYSSESRRLAQMLQQDLAKDTGLKVASPMEVPVRVLRSIGAPAVAIEVGSLAPEVDSAPLTKPSFQKAIAAAVVQAIENLQGGQP